MEADLREVQAAGFLLGVPGPLELDGPPPTGKIISNRYESSACPIFSKCKINSAIFFVYKELLLLALLLLLVPIMIPMIILWTHLWLIQSVPVVQQILIILITRYKTLLLHLLLVYLALFLTHLLDSGK